MAGEAFAGSCKNLMTEHKFPLLGGDPSREIGAIRAQGWQSVYFSNF